MCLFGWLFDSTTIVLLGGWLFDSTTIVLLGSWLFDSITIVLLGGWLFDSTTIVLLDKWFPSHILSVLNRRHILHWIRHKQLLHLCVHIWWRPEVGVFACGDANQFGIGVTVTPLQWVTGFSEHSVSWNGSSLRAWLVFCCFSCYAWNCKNSWVHSSIGGSGAVWASRWTSRAPWPK